MVKAAWALSLIISLLQLDLKGAFDMVNYEWLKATLMGQGWPRWVTREVASFLKDRVTTLSVKGSLAR